MKKDSQSQNVSEGGFSIVEMIVAMVVFTVVIGTIYGLLQVGLIDRNRASRRSDVLKNARAAMHLIGRDALNAGLSYNKSGAIVPDGFITARLGIPTYADSQRDVLTSIVGGNNLFFDILSADTTVRTDLISFSYRDSDFNAGDVISLNSAGAASGSPGTIRLQGPANAAQSVRNFDLFLVESTSSQVAVMATGVPTTSAIDIAPGDPLGINQPINGTGTNSSVLKACNPPAVISDCTTYPSGTTSATTVVAAVKRFFWVAYKVKSDGTLVRQTFGNNSGAAAADQIQELPVAYNIEDFQIRYVLEDGSTTDNPGAGPDKIAGNTDDRPSDFNLVRQITVTIKVQSTENDEQSKKPESITLSGTFSTRNLEYDAG